MSNLQKPIVIPRTVVRPVESKKDDDTVVTDIIKIKENQSVKISPTGSIIEIKSNNVVGDAFVGNTDGNNSSINNNNNNNDNNNKEDTGDASTDFPLLPEHMNKFVITTFDSSQLPSKKKNIKSWDQQIFKLPSGSYTQISVDRDNHAYHNNNQNKNIIIGAPLTFTLNSKSNIQQSIHMPKIISTDTSSIQTRLSDVSVRKLLGVPETTCSNGNSKVNQLSFLDRENLLRSGKFTFPIVDSIESFVDILADINYEYNKKDNALKAQYKENTIYRKDYSKINILKSVIDMVDIGRSLTRTLRNIHTQFCNLYQMAISHYHKMAHLYFVESNIKSKVSFLGNVIGSGSNAKSSYVPPTKFSEIMSSDVYEIMKMENCRLVQPMSIKNPKFNLMASINEHISPQPCSKMDMDDLGTEFIVIDNESDTRNSACDEMEIEDSESKNEKIRDFNNQFSYLWKLIDLYYDFDIDFSSTDPNYKKLLLAELDSGIFTFDHIIDDKYRHVSPKYDNTILNVFNETETKVDKNSVLESIEKAFCILAILDKQSQYMHQLQTHAFEYQCIATSILFIYCNH